MILILNVCWLYAIQMWCDALDLFILIGLCLNKIAKQSPEDVFHPLSCVLKFLNGIALPGVAGDYIRLNPRQQQQQFEGKISSSLVVCLLIFRKCKSVFIGLQGDKHLFNDAKIVYILLIAIKSMEIVELIWAVHIEYHTPLALNSNCASFSVIFFIFFYLLKYLAFMC